MPVRWSQQFAAQLHLAVPPDLADWLDSQRWQQPGGGEFHQPLSPTEILQPSAGAFWSGCLLPDTVPVIGNDYGDWLCLRVSATNTIAEWIAWSHAGGDWIGAGPSLAAALLADARRYTRNPERTGHAAWAERDSAAGAVDQHGDWAESWLAQGRGMTGDSASPERPTQVSQPLPIDAATAREQLLECLDNPLRQQADFRFAQRLGVAWEPEMASWLFDGALIPDSWQTPLRHSLNVAHGLPESPLPWGQDWHGAEQVARRVLDQRRDLSWPFAIAGWACERRGERQAACELYYAGLQASAFTDETARLHSQWASGGQGKFVAARLAQLRDCWNESLRQDEYLTLLIAGAGKDDLPGQVSAYWWLQGRRAEEAAERQSEPRAWQAAYQAYYRAGWDLGLTRRSAYPPILEALVRTARQAGSLAQAAVAQWHLNNLR
ncbi:MAG: hypothetical protein ACKOBW_01830 [Planctomycetota bacterium]